MKSKFGLAGILGACIACGCAYIHPVTIEESRIETDIDDPNWNGFSYISENPKGTAKETFQRAYDDSLNELGDLRDLCEGYRKKGDYKQALKYANSMVKKYPHSSLPYRSRASVYEDLKDYKNALKDTKKAEKYE